MGFSANFNDAQRKARAQQEADFKAAGGAALSGSGTGILDVSGSEEARQGGLEGLQMGQMLYGQGMADVGKEAGDYSSRVKGLLGKDYAGADYQRQLANQALAKNTAKMGLGATNTFGAQEQLRRQGSMQAAQMNQDYQDKALALYGKNISAKQQGMTSTYFGAKGIGQASTPGVVAGSGGSIICTELYNQGKLSKNEYLRAAVFGYSVHPNVYFGYLTIAKPMVKLMKKSDKFSNLFVGWAKSIAVHKPNTLTKILMPICWMVGYVRKIEKKENARVA
jgi:hypothetical protein